MNFLNNITLIVLIIISIIIALYYYRKDMVDNVIKGKIILGKLLGENSLGRLPELFTLGLGVLIGFLLIGMLI